MPVRLPTPPPQIRSPAVVPPGWKARTALHPTLQVDDRATPPSPPCSPLVVVKEEDIDRGVAGFAERSSYYRACQSEPRDDFPEHMYPSSRSASPESFHLPGIVVTKSDSASPSPPSSPLTPPYSPPQRVRSSPADITSFYVPDPRPLDSRTHRRSRSQPFSVPPQSKCGDGRRPLYDAISRRQLPLPTTTNRRRRVTFDLGGCDYDSGDQSPYDWRDLQSTHDSILVSTTERRYDPYRRSPTPVIPDVVLPRFVERNELNGAIPLPSFYKPPASEEPPSPPLRHTPHLAYFSD